MPSQHYSLPFSDDCESMFILKPILPGVGLMYVVPVYEIIKGPSQYLFMPLLGISLWQLSNMLLFDKM